MWRTKERNWKGQQERSKENSLKMYLLSIVLYLHLLKVNQTLFLVLTKMFVLSSWIWKLQSSNPQEALESVSKFEKWVVCIDFCDSYIVNKSTEATFSHPKNISKHRKIYVISISKTRYYSHKGLQPCYLTTPESLKMQFQQPGR